MDNQPKDPDEKEALLIMLTDEFMQYSKHDPQKFIAIDMLFEELAGRMDHKQLWVVDELLALLRTVGRGTVIDALRALDSIGLGDFVVGRRGQPSRFQWKFDAHSVTDALEASKFQGATSRQSGGSLSVQSKAQTLLSHHFRLRPDLTVELQLPVDLSSTEAARLADFVRTLPFAP
ncbi:hypothetical protein [Pyxidicoccus trucidator]|uniref:hypothetical protein n=1 Tax=Pyxidicoccus trucidator TaxID=2709662 RepID=UPI0013D9A8CB|nr:hypothetical protein [Pyxidicoccus trucidator]